MKKIKKGFMLVETLVVSIFILSTLVFLFVQFQTIKKSYERSFTYNTVEGLYATSNVAKYLSSEGFYQISYDLAFSGARFISFYNSDSTIADGCQEKYIIEKEYCNTLMNQLNIKSVIFTKENLGNLKSKIDEWTSNKEKPEALSNRMIDYIKTISYQGLPTYYRLIVEFKDDTFATLITDGTEQDEYLIPEELVLVGEPTMTLSVDNYYVEPGYYIRYHNGIIAEAGDNTSVTVDGYVKNEVGTYTLTYTLTYFGRTISTATRTVTVEAATTA